MSKDPGYKENELLRRVAAGDRQAFTLLYEQHTPWLVKYIRLFTIDGPDIEEIVQDVFVKVWQHKDQLPALDSFGAWLNRVARNTLFNYLRTLRIKHKIESLEGEVMHAGSEHADHRLLFHQYYTIAFRAIEQLPPRRREVFKLRLEHNLTYDQIAAQLGVSRSAVEQHMYAATAFIREYLQKYADISTCLFLFISLFDY